MRSSFSPYAVFILTLCGLHSHPMGPHSHLMRAPTERMWVNPYRENGRQQNKSVGAPLLANHENERRHEVKTATDIYAYRETAARFHMVNAWLPVNDSNRDVNLVDPSAPRFAHSANPFGTRVGSARQPAYNACQLAFLEGNRSSPYASVGRGSPQPGPLTVWQGVKPYHRQSADRTIFQTPFQR